MSQGVFFPETHRVCLSSSWVYENNELLQQSICNPEAQDKKCRKENGGEDIFAYHVGVSATDWGENFCL